MLPTNIMSPKLLLNVSISFPLFLTSKSILATDEEEPLEDPIPLRNMKRPEGKRAQIFLRYRDDPDKAHVKIYGGWLRYRFH